MIKYDEIYGNIGAIGLDESHGDASEKNIKFMNQMIEAMRKVEKFDECLRYLEDLNHPNNPHPDDVMRVYDNVASVFKKHLEEE